MSPKRKRVTEENITAVYRFIVSHCKKTGGVSPTQREIQRHFGLSSTSVVYSILNILESAGMIKRIGAGKSISVVGATWTPPFSSTGEEAVCYMSSGLTETVQSARILDCRMEHGLVIFKVSGLKHGGDSFFGELVYYDDDVAITEIMQAYQVKNPKELIGKWCVVKIDEEHLPKSKCRYSTPHAFQILYFGPCAR